MLIYPGISAHERRPQWGSSGQMGARYPSDHWFSYNNIQLVELTKPYCPVPLVVDPKNPEGSCPIPFGIGWLLFQIPCNGSWRERIGWCKAFPQLRDPCIASKAYTSVACIDNNRNKVRHIDGVAWFEEITCMPPCLCRPERLFKWPTKKSFFFGGLRDI